MRSILREGRDWAIAPAPAQSLIDTIRSALGCSVPYATLLAQRGGENWASVIDPGTQSFHSPFLLHDMERAVERLQHAFDRKEKIFIHGDFDADGLTGAAVLYRALRPLLPANSIKVEVGERAHGHGLSKPFVLRAIQEGFQLVITVDCGISNHDEIAELKRASIDTIITDHHLPAESLPEAVAIVDPHQAEDSYPNPNLAGVGVAYKLVCAVYERLGRPAPMHLLDLVALGTVADLVPLSSNGESENRAIVREAFARIGKGGGCSLGLRALSEKLSVKPEKIRASDIGYLIAPKLNAANRAGDPKVAFLLLITEDADQAEYLAEILLDYNRDREIAQNDLIAQADEQIRADGMTPREDGILFLVGKYWNEGILGLVASSLADRFHVPAIVVSRGDRLSRGSCRSVGEFDMNACLKAHDDLLLQHGGHKSAAGFTVANEMLPALEERLLAYADTCRADVGTKRVDLADVELNLADVDMRLLTDLASLGPYGPGNPEPRFVVRDCSFSELKLVGNRRQHLKGKASQRGTPVPLIAFRMGKHLSLFEETKAGTLVCSVGFDDWRNDVQVQGHDLVVAA